ncbi:uncharacterized protein LOC123681671 [Harmonia axyridis]|uniref:uncharacterized protein LOC123681671 n=1 Tax=Harmonia axyridis TaxID=115357 RepID=UPI001E277286|nr:uncharacterized protein LOC123681671 [Harmonia axyridis]
MAINRITIIKAIELALAVICLFLHTKSHTGNSTQEIISIAAFGGFTIILTGLFIGKVVDSAVGSKIDLYYSIVGVVLFVAAGYYNIDTFKDDGADSKNYGLIKGSLAIINAVVFLIDALLGWRV